MVAISHLSAHLLHPQAAFGVPTPFLAVILVVCAAVVLGANPRDVLVRLFASLLLTCAVVVAFYPLSAHGVPPGRPVEFSADGLCCALFVRFCFAFPERRPGIAPPAHWMRALRRLGPPIPAAASLAYVLAPPDAPRAYALAQEGFYLGIAFGTLLGLFALARTFRAHPRPEVRWPSLIVLLSATVAFLPLLALDLVPALFAHRALVPFPDVQYTLVALPLGVGVATVPWRRPSPLALVDRLSVYGLLGLFLVACLAALIFAAAGVQGVPLDSGEIFVSLALAVIVAATFAPLHARLQHFVDRVLYRDDYDLGETVRRLSRALTAQRDRDSVARALLAELCARLNLTGAALLVLPAGLDADALRTFAPAQLYTCRLFDDAPQRERLTADLRALDPASIAPSRRHPVQAAAAPDVPAVVFVGSGGQHEPCALLLIGRKRSGAPLRAGDETLLSIAAHQAATALDNVALFAALDEKVSRLRQSTDALAAARTEQQLLLRELVDADERQRAALARDLHDDALQDLVYVARHGRYCADRFAAVAAALPPDRATRRLAEEIAQLAEAAGASERKVRDLCAGLYPALIESLGLPAAVEALADDPSAATGPAVDAACDPDAEALAERLAPEVRLHAYRVAQEALRNAVRHARAGRVSLRLALAPCAAGRDAAHPAGEPAAPRLVLTVDDDGAGMPLPPDYVALLRAGHLGLAGMRERAERIGADLAVTRGAAGGTRVLLAIPIPAGRANAGEEWPDAALDALPGPTPTATRHASTSPVRVGA